MWQEKSLKNILFLDIETVSECSHYNDLSEEKKELWASKSKHKRKEVYSPEEFYDRAGIWAEFGRIICISVGYFSVTSSKRSFRITSFHGEETAILKEFNHLLETHFNKSFHLLCAYNGKEFDFPYIARRCIINNLKLPSKLNLFGKKPWEIPHLDIMEMWRFGDYKHYTSLKLLVHILNIPSPKDDIDGSMVNKVYYQENDLDRIVRYCEKDVITIAQVFLRYKNLALLEKNEIVYV